MSLYVFGSLAIVGGQKIPKILHPQPPTPVSISRDFWLFLNLKLGLKSERFASVECIEVDAIDIFSLDAQSLPDLCTHVIAKCRFVPTPVVRQLITGKMFILRVKSEI